MRFVIRLACTVVSLGKESPITPVRLECAFLFARLELAEDVANRRDRRDELSGGTRHRDPDIKQCTREFTDSTDSVSELLRHNAIAETLVRGQRPIESIILKIKRIEAGEGIFSETVVIMSLHHAFDGHPSGGGGVVSLLRNDANEVTTAAGTLNAKLVACRNVLDCFQDSFHQLTIDIREIFRGHYEVVFGFRRKGEKSRLRCAGRSRRGESCAGARLHVRRERRNSQIERRFDRRWRVQSIRLVDAVKDGYGLVFAGVC